MKFWITGYFRWNTQYDWSRASTDFLWFGRENFVVFHWGIPNNKMFIITLFVFCKAVYVKAQQKDMKSV